MKPVVGLTTSCNETQGRSKVKALVCVTKRRRELSHSAASGWEGAEIETGSLFSIPVEALNLTDVSETQLHISESVALRE